MSTRPIVKPDLQFEVYEFFASSSEWTRLAAFTSLLDAGVYAIARSKELHRRYTSGWEIAVTPDLDDKGKPYGWTSFFPVSGQRKRLTHTSEFPVI